MLLVNAIESQLYPLELWPTYILTCIFAFGPHMPFSLTQLEKVIAFFSAMGSLYQRPINSLRRVEDTRFPSRKKQFGYLYDMVAI